MKNMEVEKFQNGNDLLKSCIQKLNESQYGKTGGNVALYPIVVIFMGNISKNYVGYIKNTLEDNWSNARFLQYLNVCRDGDGWKCISLEGQDNNFYESFENLLNISIQKMLQTEEKIFADRRRVKLEFVLDATEEDSITYYELFLKTSSSVHTTNLKTLYLMIDQRIEDSKAIKSDKVVQHIIQDSKRGEATIYFLSNHLQSGWMLSDNNIWQNYRLVANIILLGGNRSSAHTYADRIYNGLKTVSYALVTKPTDEIAAVSLQALLSEMYGAEKKDTPCDLSEKNIKDKLEMDDYNGIRFVDELFQKEIEVKFPKTEFLQYLPFETEQAYEKMMSAKKIKLADLDEATMGSASAYICKYYKKEINNVLDEEEKAIRHEVCVRLMKNFRYFDLLELDKMRMELKRIIQAEYYYAGSGKDDFIGQVGSLVIYESKAFFYKKMKTIVTEELERLIDASLQFQEMYRQCEEEIQKERIITGDESESVEKVYRNIVKEFIENCYRNKRGFGDVFCVNESKEKLLSAIWEAFIELIKNEIYSFDFEKEVDFRLERMNDEERHIFVTKELKKKLEGSVRLKSFIHVNMLKTSCFYMVNKNANYAINLQNANGNDKDYLLFNLNRTDCIEQLELFNIIEPELIRLAGNGDRNGG